MTISAQEALVRVINQELTEKWTAREFADHLLAALSNAGEPVAWAWRYDSVGHAVVNKLVVTETKEAPTWLANMMPRGPWPLYAAPTGNAPDGWKLVPLEPTPDMVDATWDVVAVREIYKAMVAFAPSYPSPAAPLDSKGSTYG